MSTFSPIEALVHEIHAGQDAVDFLAHLFTYLRAGAPEEATQRLDQLTDILKSDPEHAQVIGLQLHALLAQLQIYPALVHLGIFSRQGLMREIINILYNRANPPPLNLEDSVDVLATLLSHHDQAWLEMISERAWLRFYRVLLAATPQEQVQAVAKSMQLECYYALEMLAIWVAAEELEPELIRIDQRLTNIDSPFIALQREIHAYIQKATLDKSDAATIVYDLDHLWVMLEQCKEQVARFRRRGGSGVGSSMHASRLIERLEQTLERIELLLGVIHPEYPYRQIRKSVSLWTSLLQASIEKSSIRAVWEKSTRILSRSITENKSHHGEHYISRDLKSYWSLIATAAGAGVIIALMALLKINIEALELNPLPETILISLNYGIGFVIIHLFHFTIATKQPAMTAASFAAEVEKNKHGRASSRKLAQLLLDVNRSQWAAVWGNISTAILTALLITSLIFFLWQQPLLSSDEVNYHLRAISPIDSLALLYAAIAGFWLFLSGIIAGFFDNRANYLRLNERFIQHPLLQKIPVSTRENIANYLHENYGALAGNFLFGVMLGSTGYIGYLLGLPLDIRHVAFSSANLGYATFSEFMGWFPFFMGLVFVLMIGFVNLWVSFTLALFVALRSRGCKIQVLAILVSVKDEFLRNPLRFFIPLAQPTNKSKQTETEQS